MHRRTMHQPVPGLLSVLEATNSESSVIQPRLALVVLLFRHCRALMDYRSWIFTCQKYFNLVYYITRRSRVLLRRPLTDAATGPLCAYQDKHISDPLCARDCFGRHVMHQGEEGSEFFSYLFHSVQEESQRDRWKIKLRDLFPLKQNVVVGYLN